MISFPFFALLPLFTLVILFLSINGRDLNSRDHYEDWRAAFIKAAILVALITLISLEFLSLLESVTQLWVSVFWSITFLIALGVGWRYGWLSEGWRNFLDTFRGWRRIEVVFLASIVMLTALLFIIAVASPPNNVDAQVYHLPRVAQWVQNQSLNHFPTTQHGQLIKPYTTEMGILTLRILAGGEKLSNLIQYVSMLGCIIGASAIAKLMKVNRLGQILTAVFVLSIPLGILQSTNTKNDYVTAFWMISLAFFTVLSKRKRLTQSEVFFIGVSLGLGMLTKGTFYIYAFPVLLWLLIPQLKRIGVRRTVVQATGIGILAILINLGLWARNVQTYGGLFGHPGTLRGPLITDELFTAIRSSPENIEEGAPSTPITGESQYPSEDQGPSEGFQLTWVGEILKLAGKRVNWIIERTANNLAQNIIMPELTAPLQRVLYAFPSVFHVDFVDSLGTGLWNHEDTAGNLLHLVLISLTGISSTIIAYKEQDFLPVLYSLVIFAGFTALSFISYSVALFGIRYQLSFFVLGAPLIGVASTWVGRKWLTVVLIILLLVYALPYIFLNNMRPLIGWRPRTRIPSIFTASDAEIMFATLPDRRDEYEMAVERIRKSGCRSVGIGIPADDLEYPVWWLLGAPESGIHIESITPVPVSEIYVDQGFQPCALICIDCQGRELDLGLPLEGDYGHFRLFINP